MDNVIKNLRIALGHSESQVADICEISNERLRSIEKGTHPAPVSLIKYFATRYSISESRVALLLSNEESEFHLYNRVKLSLRRLLSWYLKAALRMAEFDEKTQKTSA